MTNLYFFSIMLTYYAAQLGIALSVIDSYDSHQINHEVIRHQDLVNGIKNIYKNFKYLNKKKV